MEQVGQHKCPAPAVPILYPMQSSFDACSGQSRLSAGLTGAAAALRLRRLALRLLLLRTLGLLGQDASQRRVAVRNLVPMLVHAAAAAGGALHTLAVKAVWAQCRCVR